MPAACAAAASSRVARSERPKRLRWYANATAITTTVPIAACVRSVVSGTSESVVAPGPIFVHSRRRLCVISSTANVAMPAASPESRISGTPTRNANVAPTRAASTSEGRMPIVWSRSSGKRSGRTPCFDSSGTVITPEANAPTATKLIWPNDSTPELPTKT